MPQSRFSTRNDPETVQRVLKTAEEQQVRFVNLQFTDIVGVVKSVTIPTHRFEGCIKDGMWFDGSSIEGFARIAESDMYLQPDLNTFCVTPWELPENRTARVFCQVFTPKGEPFAGDPRSVLLRVMAEAEDMGYIYNTGPELEFFLFRLEQQGRVVPLPHDQAGYFDFSTDLASEVRKEMVNSLQALGIRVEASHHEVAIGQHEIDFEYADALRTADNAVTFKYALKAVAQKHDLYATFMPKPLFGINGSGMHVHQSLFNAGPGTNAFYDANDEYGLSQVAKHFMAGQLAHARGMCAITAPLVNSYKRLVPGYEAPVYISWARINRSALIRIPKTTPGKISSTRMELRCPDPSCNPYLAFAVMLKCGLEGIVKEMPLPEPVEENLYLLDEAQLLRRNVGMLPGSLKEALMELEQDEVVKEALGPHVYQHFVEAKTMEWNDFRKQVTAWELERYLEIY